MFNSISHYKKAVYSFVAGLAGIWAVVGASDWSTKNGAIASIVPIVSAVIVYFTKNGPAA